MSITSRKTRRRPAWTPAALVTLTLVLGLTGCAPPKTADAPFLAIAITGTANEPEPSLPAAVEAEAKDRAEHSHRVGGAVVALIVQGRPARLVDLTPMRKDRVENADQRRAAAVQRNLQALEAAVATATAATPGLDLLGTLDTAALVAPGIPIVAVSSAVSTADPADLGRLGWPDQVADLVEWLERTRQLPLHLTGHPVRLFHVGDVAGAQPALPNPVRLGLVRFVEDACDRAGGDCRAEDDLPSGQPPRATLPVPVVAVPPPPEPPRRPDAQRCETVTSVPSALLFGPDSAELVPQADAALQPVVDTVRAGRGETVVSLVRGHTADAGPGDGLALSRQRARAVAEALARLGVPAGVIRTVDGVGESQPVVPNWTDDGRQSSQAARNRRVEIRLSTTSCTHSTPVTPSTEEEGVQP